MNNLTPTLKDLMGITNDKRDIYLDAVIPLFLAKMQKYTSNHLLDNNGELPKDLILTMKNWVQFDMNSKPGIQSKKMGEVSYTYTQNLPSFVKEDLAPYRKLRTF